MTDVLLVYVSTASAGLRNDDVSDIVATAQRDNQRFNITGLLLFNGVNFMQVLEGSRERVLALYAKLHKDGRHSGLIALAQLDIKARSFDNWSMRFIKTNNAGGHVERLAAGSGLTAADLPSNLPENVKQMLSSFTTLGSG